MQPKHKRRPTAQASHQERTQARNHEQKTCSCEQAAAGALLELPLLPAAVAAQLLVWRWKNSSAEEVHCFGRLFQSTASDVVLGQHVVGVGLGYLTAMGDDNDDDDDDDDEGEQTKAEEGTRAGKRKHRTEKQD